MAYEHCENCAWALPEPGLGETIIGKVECTNCGHDRVMSEAERLEVGQSFDQRIHMLEQGLWPTNK